MSMGVELNVGCGVFLCRTTQTGKEMVQKKKMLVLRTPGALVAGTRSTNLLSSCC